MEPPHAQKRLKVGAVETPAAVVAETLPDLPTDVLVVDIPNVSYTDVRVQTLLGLSNKSLQQQRFRWIESQFDALFSTNRVDGEDAASIAARAKLTSVRNRLWERLAAYTPSNEKTYQLMYESVIVPLAERYANGLRLHTPSCFFYSNTTDNTIQWSTLLDSMDRALAAQGPAMEFGNFMKLWRPIVTNTLYVYVVLYNTAAAVVPDFKRGFLNGFWLFELCSDVLRQYRDRRRPTGFDNARGCADRLIAAYAMNLVQGLTSTWSDLWANIGSNPTSVCGYAFLNRGNDKSPLAAIYAGNWTAMIRYLSAVYGICGLIPLDDPESIAAVKRLREQLRAQLVELVASSDILLDSRGAPRPVAYTDIVDTQTKLSLKKTHAMQKWADSVCEIYRAQAIKMAGYDSVSKLIAFFSRGIQRTLRGIASPYEPNS